MTNRLIRTTFFLLLTILPFHIFCQSGSVVLGDALGSNLPKIIQPSQESQELIKMIETGIDLSNGKLNVSLPIYTINTDGVKVPISINYNAGGVKVNDTSTDIGLGWTLQAGGRITRTIRGNRPDEFPGLGYLDFKENFPQSFPLSNNIDDLWDFVNNVYYSVDYSSADTEPDLFYFSVPGGSGSFILRKSGQTKLLTASQTKITWSKSSGELEFRLVTPDGKIHIFGEGNLDYTEQRTFPAAGLNHVSDYSCITPMFGFDPEPAVTTWHLSRLYQGFGANETVLFSYIDDISPIEYQGVYSEVLKTAEQIANGGSTVLANCPPILSESVSGCITRLKHDVHHISEIESKDYKVMFSYSGTRPDLDGGGRRLNKIEVYHKKDNELYPMMTYDFKMNFWTSAGSLTGTSAMPSTTKRMYLDRVEIKNGLGDVLPGYNFHYSNGNGLPPRLSFDQDYWGYYNAAGNTSFIPFPNSGIEGNIDFLGILIRHAPADRSPNEAVSNYGTLSSYEDQYGGTTSFEYENHRVSGIDSPLCTYEVRDVGVSASYAYSGPDVNTSPIFTIPFDQEVKVKVIVNQKEPSDFDPPGAYALLRKLTDWNATSPYQEIKKWSKNHNVEMPHTINKEEVIFLTAGEYRSKAMVNFLGENVNIHIKYLSKVCEDNLVGGLRLKTKIEKGVSTSYEYKLENNAPSGMLMALPKYTNKTLRMCPVLFPPSNSPEVFPVQDTQYERNLYSSYSSRVMAKANGNHVEYRRVKEILPENGSTVKKFTILPDEPVGIAKINYESAHAPRGDNSWQSGLLKSVEYLDETNNLLKKEIYEYALHFGNDDIVYGLAMKKEYDQDLFYIDSSSINVVMEYIDQYSMRIKS